jgi:hypothetical protein
MADKVEKVTITKDELASAIAQAVALALEANKSKTKAKGAKSGRAPLTDEQKTANRDKTDKATVANFAAKGYKDVQPRINVMTYNKWIENGRRVKKGEKATICGSFALFIVDQTDPILVDEKATKH